MIYIIQKHWNTHIQYSYILRVLNTFPATQTSVRFSTLPSPCFKVCQASYQYLGLMRKRPVINLENLRCDNLLIMGCQRPTIAYFLTNKEIEKTSLNEFERCFSLDFQKNPVFSNSCNIFEQKVCHIIALNINWKWSGSFF